MKDWDFELRVLKRLLKEESPAQPVKDYELVRLFKTGKTNIQSMRERLGMPGVAERGQRVDYAELHRKCIWEELLDGKQKPKDEAKSRAEEECQDKARSNGHRTPGRLRS